MSKHKIIQGIILVFQLTTAGFLLWHITPPLFNLFVGKPILVVPAVLLAWLAHQARVFKHFASRRSDRNE